MSRIINELFERAKRGEFLRSVDIAALVRKRLNNLFPKTKFAVRTGDRGRIIVKWLDGPSRKRVRRITNNYETAGFDGMIDLEYSFSCWLSPDGILSLAGTDGTQSSRGTIPSQKWPAHSSDAIWVRNIDSVYVDARHYYSREAIERGIARVAEYDYRELRGVDWMMCVDIVPDYDCGFRITDVPDVQLWNGDWLSNAIMKEVEKAFEDEEEEVIATANK